PTCAEAYEPDPALLRQFPAPPEGVVFRRGSGCPACNHTGFCGRTALCEILGMDDSLRAAILDKLPTRRLQELARSQGMSTLWDTAVRRVWDGETTVEEVLRVLPGDET